MNLLKAFQKKEAGLPESLQWQYVKGVWTPYDSKDEVFVEKAYKAIPIVQSIISKIIEKAADAQPQIMRIKDEREASKYFAYRKGLKNKDRALEMAAMKVKAFEQVDRHPFLDLMENPNPTMTGRQLREELFGYLLITGNSIEYAAMPGAGQRATQPVELWSVPSPCVKPVMSGSRTEPLAGYAITYNFDKVIPTQQITHVKYFNPVSDFQGFESSFWGISPLRSSVNLISQKRFADSAQGSLFANMGPSGLISGSSQGAPEKGTLTEEQAIQVNDTFRQNHMGVHNAGDIIVTPADVKWVQIGLSPVDLNILDFSKDLERQIANVYGYPSQLLEPSGTLANSSAGDTRVITNCVLPLLRKYDDMRTAKIREWYNDPKLVYLSDTDVYPELEADKIELVKWMRSAGVFSQDEIRAALGYGENYNPDSVLVPSNLVPLSDIMSGDLEVGNEM